MLTFAQPLRVEPVISVARALKPMSSVLLTYTYTCHDADEGVQQLELELMPNMAAWAIRRRSSLGQRAELVANLPGRGICVLGTYDTAPVDEQVEVNLESNPTQLVRKARRYGLRIVA